MTGAAMRRVWTGCGLFLALFLAVSPLQASYAWPGPVPLRPDLPSGLDLMESGLYWLQDMTGAGNPRDPASVVALWEEQAGRLFDLAYMAWKVAGPDYARLNVLERAHFQNRLRDEMFSRLARQMGLLDVRMPYFRPLPPVRTSAWSWTLGGVVWHRGGPWVRLGFHFYLTPRGWRIYDVTANGVSFTDQLRREGFRP